MMLQVDGVRTDESEEYGNECVPEEIVILTFREEDIAFV
jgi:hypothetical protein